MGSGSAFQLCPQWVAWRRGGGGLDYVGGGAADTLGRHRIQGRPADRHRLPGKATVVGRGEAWEELGGAE